MKKTIAALFLLLTTLLTTYAQQATSEPWQGNSNTSEFEFVEDNFIVAALDSLSTLKYFENAENTKAQLNHNKYNFLPNFVPSYHDSVYYYRMQKLDVESPINLSYNPYVRSFIDLYANKRRGTMSRVLGLAQYYFPMFEQQLDKYNIPLEMKYLAIVESALNAKARSRVGAGGLWQFMYYTGKVYGLEVTSLVDDRNDPLKATVAACRHFNDLYSIYNDWLLVLAAYNSGAGNVNKAIRRSGGKRTFWEIMPYLPRETRDYVPAFIAVNYVMAHTAEHNIYPIMPKTLYYETDTVAVKQPLSFSVLSEKLNISISDLEFLNPTFRKDFIPATPATPFFIKLPNKLIADFVNNESALYAYNELKGYDATKYSVNADDIDYEVITKLKTHKVKKGETLVTIARKYDCTTSEIKKWNKLKKSSVYKGQTLKIYTQSRQAIRAKAPKENPDNQTIVAKADSSSVDKVENAIQTEIKVLASTTKPRYHIVKKGETLSVVARKYNVTTKNLMAWNKLKSHNLLVGQKLKVNSPIAVSEKDKQVAEAANNQTTQPKPTNQKESATLKYHVVQKGEFAANIASKYGITLTKLVDWNKLDNTNILVGQKLIVSSSTNSQPQAQKPNPQQSTKANDNSKLIYYTVKSGDTLWSISQKYDGVTAEQIKEWNKLKSSSLKVGQKLKVILPLS